MIDMLGKMARREGLGDLLAEGSKRASEKLGRGSEDFAMHVKGLELPCYDSRATKITGLAFVTANRGGDHITAYSQGPTFLDIPWLIIDDSTIADPTVENPAEAKVVRDLEDTLTTFDCLGLCKFMGMPLMADEVVPVINAATGWDMDVEEFRQAGERVYNLARAYNVREGGSRTDDKLPRRLTHEPLPEGPAEGLTVDLDPMLDAYYEFRGWNKETGKPSAGKLTELGLGDLAEQIGVS
jgi:aldehyde:ferredoxin oxidoreductase